MVPTTEHSFFYGFNMGPYEKIKKNSPKLNFFESKLYMNNYYKIIFIGNHSHLSGNLDGPLYDEM